MALAQVTGNTEISLHEVAETLNVHYMTVYRYVRQGLLPAKKIGRSWFVTSRDLKVFRAGKGVGVAVAPTAGGRKKAPWAQRLEARLIVGDERGALEVMESALRAGHDLNHLYLGVLSQALVSIGERWERNELDIFVEHRASGIAMRLIGQIGSRFARRGVTKGTVIMGAPAGEEHTLMIAMVADIVRYEGWNVFDLGANLPAHAFAAAVERTDDVVAVCVVVTVAKSLPAAAKAIQAIKAISPDGVPCFVGGAAVQSKVQAVALGADEWTGNVDRLVDSLKGFSRHR